MTSRSKNIITIIDTVWLYPIADIERALAATSQTYTFDGTNLIVPDLPTFVQVYKEIFEQTELSQPVGNTGFSLGVGSYLEDRGKDIFFKLPSGLVILHWRLVKQITPQTVGAIPVPGNSPNGTIGYVTASTSLPHGYNFWVDNVLVARVG